MSPPRPAPAAHARLYPPNTTHKLAAGTIATRPHALTMLQAVIAGGAEGSTAGVVEPSPSPLLATAVWTEEAASHASVRDGAAPDLTEAKHRVLNTMPPTPGMKFRFSIANARQDIITSRYLMPKRDILKVVIAV